MTASRPNGPAVRLGLTGGIGSGKSTVASMLARLGACVIDADAISRASTAPGGQAIAAIAQTFGHDFIDASGALDRDRMRSLVFSDPRAKERLEAIVHPIVQGEIEQRCRALPGGCAVLDIPLLTPASVQQYRLDTVWVVDCQPDTQIQRVMLRNGWSRAQVTAVLAAQMARDERLALADTVIDNDTTTLEQLETQVRTAYQALCTRFGL
ncbi:MAG TPA: dephospho-CoA kinase [Macromonas sp.]|nr:dephospho-CoA kinase [Macromonas sp.]